MNNNYDLKELQRLDFDASTMNQEAEFARVMGIPFDPEKYSISIEEGANSIDGTVVEQMVISEKVPKPQFALNEVQRLDFDASTMNQEAEFERVMGIPFDPEKYSISIEEGANSIDGTVVEQMVISEKVPVVQQEVQADDELTAAQTRLDQARAELQEARDENRTVGIEEAQLNYDRAFNDYQELVNNQVQQTPVEPIQEAPVDSDHIPDYETGYAVGGFQAPAIVPGEEARTIEPEVQQQTVPGVEDAMQNYHNSGYGQNADGHYFNPNTDEYDQNYDPTKDPLFNKMIRTELTQGLTDEELLVETIRAHNRMADILNVDPAIGIDKEDINSDKYSLTEEQIASFKRDSAFVAEVNNVAPEVIIKYADLLNQLNTARAKMAEIMNKEPYPGIENEDIDAYINDINNQLDDYEVDQLRENKQKLDELKRQYPDLFANVKKKEVTKTEVTPEPEPQPEPTPEPEPQPEPTPEPEPTPSRGIDKERAKELLKNGLIFAGGVAVGVGLSCVPGVGQIRMGIAAAKIVTAVGRLGIKLWCKKHPDGKIAHQVNAISEKWNNSKFGQNVNKLRAKLHTKPLNIFINGVSVGYVAGNLVELFTGETVAQHVIDAFKHDNTPIDPSILNPTDVTPQPDVTPDPGITPEPEIVPVGITPTPPPVPDDTLIEQMIESGQNLDVSSIGYGRVSSVSDPIALIREAGKHVKFDQAVTLQNGQEMWHLAQTDEAGNLIGKGYAWFTKEEVIDAVKAMGNTAGKTL